MMAVPLKIREGDKWTHVWYNFGVHVDEVCGPLLDDDPKRDHITIQELAKYGAWTNLYDWSDPIWFQDEETRAAFVLVWS